MLSFTFNFFVFYLVFDYCIFNFFIFQSSYTFSFLIIFLFFFISLLTFYSLGRKVEALRRCAFKELPPTLIIHLKRFEFNIETLDRNKVNDRLTFPIDLNMFPYTGMDSTYN